MSFAFHDDAFSRLSSMAEVTVRRSANAAFRTWADVDCGRPPFSVQQLQQTTSAAPVEFVVNRANEFVLSVLTASEWREREMDEDAFAITYLWYDGETGEILDVDMALNLTQGQFGYCKRPCVDGTIDLQNTLTHEAGHVLGLGHSTVLGATMQPDATVGATFMRTLELDDMMGLCALSLPSYDCPDDAFCQCPAPPIVHSGGRSSRTCAVTGPIAPRSAAAHPWYGFMLVAGLCLGLRVYRRQARRGGGGRTSFCRRS